MSSDASNLTQLQRELLTIIQSGFPVCEHPYSVLAQQLNSTSQEAFEATNGLYEQKAVRRIGASFDSRKLGYTSALCAIAVSGDAVEQAASVINAYPNVTHNYLRANRYNIWFTAIAQSATAVQQILKAIVDKTGASASLYLPATKLYKIRVDFNLTSFPPPSCEPHSEPLPSSCEPRSGCAGSHNSNSVVDSAQPAIADSQNDARPITLTQTDKALIRILQEDIGNELEPYERIADALGQAQSWVLSRTQELIDAGVIRRFGAMVRHNELGFTHNVMVAWIIPDDETDAAGGIMAGYSAVSHCYRRVTTEDWPYNMYAMTHGMSEDDCATAIRQIKAALDDAGVSYKEPALLRSIKELKKSSMRYFIEDER